MSTHPVDRLLKQAATYTARSRSCIRAGDDDQARNALRRARQLLQLADQARLVEAVARLLTLSGPQGAEQ